MNKKKVVLIGAGLRGFGAFARPLKTDFKDKYDIVGLFDIDEGRMKGFCELLEMDLPQFTDFDQMVAEVKPDIAIIASVDTTHAEYVIRSLDAGLNAVSEKPLCVNAEQCKEILAAQKRNANQFAVTTHNARYSPHTTKIKDLIDSGSIGEIRSITYNEMLDLRHGSSYFRRWNRHKKDSGGLLIHKASHHFDLINWFIGSKAETVTAQGGLVSYGANASEFRGERCPTCKHQKSCEFFEDYSLDNYRQKLYYEYLKPGGYTPDMCVFSPDIDIEDFATVDVKYENGVRMTYNLTAHCSIEGQLICIEGTKGRIEYRPLASTNPNPQDSGYGSEGVRETTLEIYRFDVPGSENISVKKRSGTHGGSDPAMREDLFDNERPSPKVASLEEGVQAVLIGAAANISIKENRPVKVQELLK
jgi:predicted dehydrogenase